MVGEVLATCYNGSSMDLQIILIALGVIIVSMTLHEVMHGFVAYYLGDDTAKLQGRLTLNPVKHIDPFLTIILPLLLALSGAPIFGGARPVPFNPHRVRGGEWGVALVAIAGPLTNLVLAFLVFGAGVVSGIVTAEGVQATIPGLVLLTAIQVNLGFFAFNILPLPPLDGSRVIYALAPDFVRGWMESIERYGILLVFAIIMLGSSLIFNYMRSIIGSTIDIFMMIFGIG